MAGENTRAVAVTLDKDRKILYVSVFFSITTIKLSLNQVALEMLHIQNISIINIV